MPLNGGHKHAATFLAAAMMTACGGGGNGGTAPPPTSGGGSSAPTSPARVFEDPAAVSLSVVDVQTVLAQAIHEAKARGAPATIAVSDRVGNVLAVYQMAGAPDVTTVTAAPNGVNIGLQGQEVPSTLAAISKALTGAYLSSNGNAFSSRTASMIVQQHFPPAPNLTVGLESGPLFGVQFSQLPCSDLSARYSVGQGPFVGPHRAPLGLSADPGGFPLYKDGVLVGGIGVSSDDVYGFDPEVTDVDRSDEEAIALAGMAGMAGPEAIRANRISVDGTLLRFSDIRDQDLVASGSAPGFLSLTPADGGLLSVRGYFGEDTPAILAGTVFGAEGSGIRRTTAFNTQDAYILSDGFGNNRFAPRAGTEGTADALTTAEVTALLEEAFGILSKARAQIRQPLDSRAQVSVSVVDTNGAILGVIRSPDAPVFGTDVSLQKARTAAFMSGAQAAADLTHAGRSPIVLGSSVFPQPDVAAYVSRIRTFLNAPDSLTGTHAFADRSGGNLARPYFPDGEAPNGPGPLSVPIEQFNPFATGLQIDLVSDNIVEHIAFVTGLSPTDTRQSCGRLPDTAGSGAPRLANGLQIFPGSVPIYRGDTLVGGIGVSGDGIDQDDMISFLGLHNAGLRTGTINNAPTDIRADRIVVRLNDRDVRLRYVNCPFTPFVGSSEQNVCQGK